MYKAAVLRAGYSHHADSTTFGMYALVKGPSRLCSFFFSPLGVSSTYSGNLSSSLPFFFFSLGAPSLVPPTAPPLAAAAFFAWNLASFSAFFRSFSSSLALFSFFSTPFSFSRPGTDWPAPSALAASSRSFLTSALTAGGGAVVGPVFSPATLWELALSAMVGVV
jgi:hypothetical protein